MPSSLVSTSDTGSGVSRPLADGVSSLADEDLVALAMGAEALGRRIDALRTRIAGEIDARSDCEESGREGKDRLSERYGCRNGIEVLERLTRASAKTLRQRVRLGRSTRVTSTLTGLTRPARFPEVSAVFRAGELGFDAACYITDEFARFERRGGASHDEVDVAEREIVEPVAPNSGTSTVAEVDTAPAETALPRTYDDLQIVVDTWTAFLGRNGVEPDAEQAERFRGISLGRMRDGPVPLHGNLLPEAAAGLQLLFDAHNGSPTRFRPSSSEAGDDGSDPERYLHDPRTAPQRRHDVVVSMIQTAAASSDAPSLGGSAPTLVVTATVDDLDHGTARIERTHATVPSALAHRIACTGAVQKVVFDANGRIVNLGAPRTSFQRPPAPSDQRPRWRMHHSGSLVRDPPRDGAFAGRPHAHRQRRAALLGASSWPRPLRLADHDARLRAACEGSRLV